MGTVATGSKQVVGALGGAVGGRVPRRHLPGARYLPAPLRHSGEARPASAPGQRSAQRALRRPQRRPAGIRDRLSRVLLRANFRSETSARDGRLQPGTGAAIAAGDDRRDGTQRVQKSHHRERSRRQQQPAPLLRAVAARDVARSEEHTSELQSLTNLVCRLLLEKKKNKKKKT